MDKPVLSSLQKEFVLGEFIGQTVRVNKSVRKDMQSLEGQILDETQNTFLVETKKGRKVIPKAGSAFYFPESGVEVPGGLIRVRPEDRTKVLGKKLRK